MIAFRDQQVRRTGPDAARMDQPGRRGPRRRPVQLGRAYTDIMKTEALKAALDHYGFDAAFGGARRDEEKSRAKERIFSFRSAQHRWDPKRSGRSFGTCTTRARAAARACGCFRCPTGPSSTSGSTSSWRRSRSCRCISRPRARWCEYNGMRSWWMTTAWNPGRAGAGMEKIRFRTLGCYPLTGAVESEAADAARDHPGNAADHRRPSGRAARSIRTRRPAWRRRSRRGISDGPVSDRWPPAGAASAGGATPDAAALHHLRQRG